MTPRVTSLLIWVNGSVICWHWKHWEDIRFVEEDHLSMLSWLCLYEIQEVVEYKV